VPRPMKPTRADCFAMLDSLYIFSWASMTSRIERSCVTISSRVMLLPNWA
jgi:hypothetical protein